MQKELIDKANEIIGLIEKNERAVEALQKFSESGVSAQISDYSMLYHGCIVSDRVDFEDWEIRLMIHNKKQRIKALKAQLERL